MISVAPYKSLLQLLNAFPDEQSCIDHMEKLRWEGNVVSPFDETSSVYKLKDNRYKCRNSNKYFNVRTNTIFEGSKIPLRTWFAAIYLFTAHKRGISSYQLAEDLNVTQKTAWFVLSRLRTATGGDGEKFDGEIEVDETFVGGKNKNRHKDKKVEKSQGRSFKDKTPVVGVLKRGDYEIVQRPHKLQEGKMVLEKIVHRPTQIKLRAVSNTQTNTLQPLMREWITKGSTINSDEWKGYAGLDKDYIHKVVDHGRGQYVDGDTTTNRMENVWSHFKRSIIGTYYKVSRKHLQLYADEMSFRFNNRTNDKFQLFLKATENKRLTYKQLTNG